ncbi:hypothetical protein DXG01_012540, partial [Tephrocybe rancida]
MSRGRGKADPSGGEPGARHVTTTASLHQEGYNSTREQRVSKPPAAPATSQHHVEWLQQHLQATSPRHVTTRNDGTLCTEQQRTPCGMTATTQNDNGHPASPPDHHVVPPPSPDARRRLRAPTREAARTTIRGTSTPIAASPTLPARLRPLHPNITRTTATPSQHRRTQDPQ